jgi:uncharacterized protein (TIGR02466 family)
MDPHAHPWIESSDVLSLFPTLVWKLQLNADLRRPMDERILAALAGIRGNGSLPAGAGWQSERALHRREELHELAACVERAARAVLQFLHIGCEAIEITGCWANVLAPAASQRTHSHPNNFLSAVYYLRTASGADAIAFHDPRVQTGIIRPPVTRLSGENTDQVMVTVRDGTLLMFPAWLQHSVETNASAQERISVSFNVMFSDYTRNVSPPLW